MKLTMKELLTEWRQNLNEHKTDEAHDHPHGDEHDELEEGSTYSVTSSTRAIDEADEGSSSADTSSSRVGDESDEDHCDESLEEMIRRVAKEVMAEAWSVERGFYAKEEDLPIYREELAKLEAQGVTNHNALLNRMVKAIERRGLKWDVHTFEAASGRQA